MTRIIERSKSKEFVGPLAPSLREILRMRGLRPTGDYPRRRRSDVQAARPAATPESSPLI